MRNSFYNFLCKKEKIASPTEQIAAFFSLVLSNLILSDIFFIWLVWLALTR